MIAVIILIELLIKANIVYPIFEIWLIPGLIKKTRLKIKLLIIKTYIIHR